MTLSLIYTTSPNLELAKAIAKSLIEEQLAACVNIIPAVQSFYHWQGVLEQSEELILLIKCNSDLYSAIERKIKTLHNYDCPCIIQIPVEKAEKSFQDWVLGMNLES
jgi:periplasmic divalent cation tolerance protein